MLVDYCFSFDLHSVAFLSSDCEIIRKVTEGVLF